MGVFACPQCTEDFDTDDKYSTHQVNDLIQDTFCSCECSVNYSISNALTIIENRFGPLPLTTISIEEVLNEFSIEGLEDADLFALKLKLQ